MREFRDRVDAPSRWFDSDSVDHLPETGPITTRADAVLTALAELSSDVATAVKALVLQLDHTVDSSANGLRWRDERDAVALFAKIAGVSANDFVQLHNWTPPAVGASFISGMRGDAVQSAFGDVREDIASDLGGAGDLTVRTVVGGAGKATSSNYHLELASVVVPRPASATSGSIDAYYYHDDSGTLITLRYVGPGLAPLALPRIRHSLTELQNLLRVAVDPGSRRPDDYGLVEDPLFVRIHADEPFTTALPQTSPGAIYPIEQLSAAISSDTASYQLDRHLVPTDFARLARDGWFGAREVTRRTVTAMVAMSAETLGCAVLVVDMSPRPRGNGP
ncbi:hypothetical protein [Nocardia sp. NPDC058633]|uniref:hypothetical protein n=1 Tax=Nocardia sp. NPDC058633 TaxID=3346568 RepID=UPI00365C3F63